MLLRSRFLLCSSSETGIFLESCCLCLFLDCFNALLFLFDRRLVIKPSVFQFPEKTFFCKSALQVFECFLYIVSMYFYFHDWLITPLPIALCVSIIP